MKKRLVDAEICKGIKCFNCPFNKGKDGCLLAKRLDEIEITPEPCEDAVPRTSVEYICQKTTVSTNPYEHKYHDKFIQFMDDPEISDFGMWQQSNGFNMALLVVRFYLARVPSAQHERINGHWIEITSSNHTYKCSVCGRLLVNITDGKNNVAKNYPYCHCGADMRGEQDEAN